MSASFAAIVEALPSSSVALAASGYFTRARLRVEAERADDEAELRTRAEEVHRAAANEANERRRERRALPLLEEELLLLLLLGQVRRRGACTCMKVEGCSLIRSLQ